MSWNDKRDDNEEGESLGEAWSRGAKVMEKSNEPKKPKSSIKKKVKYDEPDKSDELADKAKATMKDVGNKAFNLFQDIGYGAANFKAPSYDSQDQEKPSKKSKKKAKQEPEEKPTVGFMGH